MKTLTDEMFDREIIAAIESSRTSLSLKDPELVKARSDAAERHVRTLVAGFGAKNEREFKKASDVESLNFQKQMNTIELAKAEGGAA